MEYCSFNGIFYTAMQLAVLLQKNINYILSLDQHWKSWIYLALCFFPPCAQGTFELGVC